MSELDRYKAKALTITGKPTWKIGYYHPAAYLHADLVEARHCIYTFPEGLIFDVNPDTLCQCTGLKDKGGRLGFDGDFVKSNRGEIWLIRWESGGYWLELATDANTSIPIQEHEFARMTLTGKNIHDKQTEQ